MAHLEVTLADGKEMRFYTGKQSAYIIAVAVMERTG
jgi:hypothetical protein